MATGFIEGNYLRGGHWPGYVAVLPIDDVGTGACDGHECIGLYLEVELVNLKLGGNDLWIYETAPSAFHIKTFAKTGRTHTK